MPPKFGQMCCCFQNSAFLSGKVNISYKEKAIKCEIRKKLSLNFRWKAGVINAIV